MNTKLITGFLYPFAFHAAYNPYGSQTHTHTKDVTFIMILLSQCIELIIYFIICLSTLAAIGIAAVDNDYIRSV